MRRAMSKMRLNGVSGKPLLLCYLHIKRVKNLHSDGVLSGRMIPQNFWSRISAFVPRHFKKHH